MKIRLKEILDAKEKQDAHKKIMNYADTIKGEINRMCVTDDLSELDTMYQHASINLKELHNIIFYKKFREDEKTGWFNNADRDEIAEKILLDAPTIIEADKEEED